MDEYAPPPTGAKWWWLIVLSVLVVIGIVALPSVLPSAPPTPTPTVPAATGGPSPSARPSGASASPDGNGIPFESGGATGYWTITQSRWTDQGLVVDMTLRVDTGTLGYSFFCFDNAGASIVDPKYGSIANEMRPGTLRRGEEAVGSVLFPLGRSSTTIILASSSGRQITALLVKG